MSRLYNIHVPNAIPDFTEILFIGESPGEDEEIGKKPFIGNSGQFLRDMVSKYNIENKIIGYGNLCQYRPYNNQFANLLGSPELKKGQDELHNTIRSIRPRVIGALGGWAQEFFTGKDSTKISHYRGSILNCVLQGCESIKVVPAYHPAYILRDNANWYAFDRDIARIVHESKDRAFNYTKREYHINPTPLQAYEWTGYLRTKSILSVDIESIKGKTEILCVGFAPSESEGYCYIWNETNYRYIKEILEDPEIKKVFQFGLFDVEMLYVNGINVQNYHWDTHTGFHVMEPDLDRTLEFQTSIFTREPYYKDEGRANIPSDTKVWGVKTDKAKLYIYNCKDVCVTFEIYLHQRSEFEGDYSNVYHLFNFEMDERKLAEHIQRAGLPIDLERKELLAKIAIKRWKKLQFGLDMLCGHRMNVNSPKQMKALFYEELKLPIRSNRNSGVTTDEDATVSLMGHVKGYIDSLKSDKAKIEWQVKLEILKLTLEIKGIRKLLGSYLMAELSLDKRCRSMVKTSSTDTGRWAMSLYVDGTGVNAQTFPRDPMECSFEEIEAVEGKSIEEVIASEFDDRNKLLELLKEDIDEIPANS